MINDFTNMFVLYVYFPPSQVDALKAVQTHLHQLNEQLLEENQFLKQRLMMASPGEYSAVLEFENSAVSRRDAAANGASGSRRSTDDDGLDSPEGSGSLGDPRPRSASLKRIWNPSTNVENSMLQLEPADNRSPKRAVRNSCSPITSNGNLNGSGPRPTTAARVPSLQVCRVFACCASCMDRPRLLFVDQGTETNWNFPCPSVLMLSPIDRAPRRCAAGAVLAN